MRATASTTAARHVSPHLGWKGTLAAAWALAGGIAGGGFVAGLLLTGGLHPEAALLMTAIFGLLGSALGCVHGAVLAHIGRPEADPNTTWLERVLTVAATVAAAGLALLLGVWLTMSAVLARAGNGAGWLALLFGAALAAAALLWATWLGWHALERAFARWPRRRLGVMLVVGAFVIISGALLVTRPIIPGTQLKTRFVVTIAVAALTTVWLATPGVIFALRLTDNGRRRGTQREIRGR
jgi:hypothetical protein